MLIFAFDPTNAEDIGGGTTHCVCRITGLARYPDALWASYFAANWESKCQTVNESATFSQSFHSFIYS